MAEQMTIVNKNVTFMSLDPKEKENQNQREVIFEEIMAVQRLRLTQRGEAFTRLDQSGNLYNGTGLG